MISKVLLKDYRRIIIKTITLEDYKRSNNFEFYYSWRMHVDTYLKNSYVLEDLEKYRKKYYDVLLHPEKNAVIGAFHEGKLIGVVMLFIEASKPKVRHKGTWGINIHPIYQNQGLGKWLLEEMEVEARNRKLIKLEASFAEGNKPTKRLYVEKMDYKIEGRRRKSTRINGSYQDIFLIGKVIG